MSEHSFPKRAYVLTALFLAVLLLPGPLWALLASRMDTTNHENRTLAAFPTGAKVEEWPSAFEDWLNDHAPFRNQFMSLNARLNWSIGTLDSGDVLLGKDNWLFLKDASDAKSISDYQGLTSYTKEELAEFVSVLGELDRRLSERGICFAIVIAPAKEGVYSRYMPDSIPVVYRPTRVQALAARLQEAGLPLVWPQQDLIEASETRQVYYKYDTHWNEVGAYLAVAQTRELLGTPIAAPESCAVTVSQEQAALCDLANVSAVWSLCTDDVYYEVDAPRAELVSRTPDGYHTRWQSDGDQTLLMLRDSFGEAMSPFLCTGYARGIVLHKAAASLETLHEQMDGLPDAVVLEAGERYSDTLLAQGRLLLSWLDELEQG